MLSKIIAGAVIGIVAGAALLAGSASASPALTLASGKLLSGPGTDYAALTTLPAGAHVDLIWCGTRQNWCLIKQHNRMGWVKAEDLNMKPGGGTDVATADGGTNGGKPGAFVDAADGSAAMATQTNTNNRGGGQSPLHIGGTPVLTVVH